MTTPRCWILRKGDLLRSRKGERGEMDKDNCVDNPELIALDEDLPTLLEEVREEIEEKADRDTFYLYNRVQSGEAFTTFTPLQWRLYRAIMKGREKVNDWARTEAVEIILRTKEEEMEREIEDWGEG